MQQRHWWRLLILAGLLAVGLYFLLRRSGERSERAASKAAISQTGTIAGDAQESRAAAQAAQADPSDPASNSSIQLWSPPTSFAGSKLSTTGGNRTEIASGRVAELDRTSLAAVTALTESIELRMPTFDGEWVTARINRRQVETSGLVMIGGTLTGDRLGTFTFSSGQEGFNGMILIPSEKLALVVKQSDPSAGGTLTLVERNITDIICSPYPTEPRPTLSFAENDQESAGGAAPVVVPILSSRPSATAVLYLDFDGAVVTDPNWNGGQAIDAKPATLTSDEIVEVWHRVSEDYVAFAVDITTDVQRYNSAPTGHRMRCIITPTDTAARGAGGVAYINSFSGSGKTFSDTIPCWVFNPGVVGVAEAVSHEFGHTLGLRHDGRTSPQEEYYFGHGDGPLSWAPIMGVGYYKNIVQWNRGDYTAANNQEDDIAVIASAVNAFGFSNDEAGSTLESATGFAGGPLGEVSIEGVIQSATDTELFSFTAPAGVVSLTVSPTSHSPNLDVIVEIKDSTGQVLATANPDLELTASITSTLATSGIYYVSIAGTGHGNPLSEGYSSYGSTGAYSVRGAIPIGDGLPVLKSGQTVSTARSISFSYQVLSGNMPTSFTAIGLPAGVTIDSTTGIVSGIPTASEGTYTVSITATNQFGSRLGSLVITLSPEPKPVVSMDSLKLARLGRPYSLQLNATALPHAFWANGLPPGLILNLATGLISGTPTATGLYSVDVSATNGSGAGYVSFTLAVVADSSRVAAGGYHSLIVRGDGTLWASGSNSHGQLGDATTTGKSVPVQVATNVASVSATTAHSLFVKTDGTLWAMGWNQFGQLGDGTQIWRSAPVQVASNVVVASAGYSHSAFLKSDGTLWVMGDNSHGQLGDGSTAQRLLPAQVATGVSAISAGDHRTFWVKTDGSLWGAGSNSYGQLGDGTTTDRATPVRIADDVFVVSSGDNQTVFVKSDGSLWGMGYNGTGLLGSSGSFNQLLPTRVADRVVGASTNSSSILYLTAESTLWLLGEDGRTTHTSAVQVDNAVISYAAGNRFIVYMTADGRFWGKGSNRERALGDGSALEYRAPIKIADGVQSAATGSEHGFFIKDNNTLWAFGSNSSGQLGDGSTIDRGTPVAVASNVIHATGGSAHSLFVTSGHQLWGMGYQTDNTLYKTPASMQDRVLRSAAGHGFSLTVKEDNTLWAVGANDFGQLGDGTTNSRTSEVFVAHDVVGVAAGPGHGLFWKRDGSLFGTGSNNSGQLGDGSTSDRTVPVPIGLVIKKAVAGSGHSLFITTDNKLFATGQNYNGLLGDGTVISRTVPVQIAAQVADAAANTSSSFFVTQDGSLWAMGENFGVSPVRMARSVTAVVANGQHALFTKSDQTLWGIGQNNVGQLGDGAVLYYETPTEIRPGRPVITSASLPFEVSIDGTATFSVAATGEGSLVYQWRKDGAAISGATGSSYIVSHASATAGGIYDVVVTSGLGSVTSAPAPLTVLNAAPRIISASTLTTQRSTPLSFWVRGANEPTLFSAVGLPAGLTIATNTGLISGVPTAAAGTYNVTVGASNSHGSGSALLSITLTGALAPVISSTRTIVVRRGSNCEIAIAASSLPHTYAATGLPAGLSINAGSGLISGAPTAPPGVYQTTILATNEGGTGSLLMRVAVIPEWQDRAAGFYSSFFIDDAGTLWAAGDNGFGQLGDGTAVNRSTPIPIAQNVAMITASVTHALFDKTDGTLWGMGWNVQGLLGLRDRTQHNHPVLIDRDVISAATGFNHTVFLKSDGTAWAVGYNYSGQLGDGTQEYRLSPVQITTNVASISTGAEHSLFLKNNGTLWACGSNSSGQLGDGTTESRLLPIQVADNVSAIGASVLSSLYLKNDGTLWGMGYNGSNQLRTREGSDLSELVPVKLADGITSLSAGSNQNVYIDSGGTLWGRGANWWGQLGNQAKQLEKEPRQLSSGVSMAMTGYYHSLFRKMDGSVWSMGTSSSGELANGYDAQQFVPINVATGVKQAAAGESHSLYITNDGILWAMGYNALGSLGDGTDVDRGEPVRIAEEVARVTTSFWHSVFVKKDGSLWAMGNNGDGQLGTGTTNPNGLSRPLHVMDSVKSAATGVWHTVVLKTDGTVWAIGSNSKGQLGDGTNVQKTLPVQVMSGVTEVAAGAKHTLFLKSDGTLWATGDNEAGQLGDGTKANRNTPLQLTTGVTHIAAGGWHSLFLKSDGTLWAMGYNQYGQLGDGTSSDRATPIMVDSNVRSMTAGTYHTQYIKQDGTLWAMGANDSGQLGEGTSTMRKDAGGVSTNAPAASASLSDKSGVMMTVPTDPVASRILPILGEAPRLSTSPTDQTSAGITSRSQQKAHANTIGYLRNGFPQIQNRPMKIGTGVSAAVAGGYHSLYIRHNASLWAMGQSLYGRLGNGAGLVQWEPKEVKFGLPAILSQSIPFSIQLGQTVELSVRAAGAGTLAYQWRKNGEALPGATSSHYLVSGVTAGHGGVYDVIVTNSLGSRTCTAVNVSVVDAAPAISGNLMVSAPRLSDGFEFQINANNDATTYAADNLPAGLILDTNTGRISGRIEALEGTMRITLRATNINGTASAVLIINVTAQAVPVITSPTTVLARCGQTFHYQIKGSNSATSFNASNLPAGLSVNLSTGIISGKIAGASGEVTAPIFATNTSGSGGAVLTFVILPVSAGLAGGDSHSMVVDDEGNLSTFGNNTNGQLGDGTQVDRATPRILTGDVIAVAASNSRSLFLRTDGTLWGMGTGLQDPDTLGFSPVRLATRVKAFACGYNHIMFVDWDGVLWTGGGNTYGQIGDGTTTTRNDPVAVATGVRSVAAGFDFSLFLRADDTLWGMGDNGVGQLGDGTTTTRFTPVQIASEVNRVAAGYNHTLFVRNDRTLWAVGNNGGGKLGDGSNISRSTPILVHSDVSEIWANRGSLFLTPAGELWAMGDTGTSNWASRVPKRVATAIVGAAAGALHILLIDSSDRILSVGYNWHGQLGESVLNISHPQKIANDVVHVSGATAHTVYVTQNGILWGLGDPWSGQRGEGAYSLDRAPITAAGEVDGIASGSNFTLFIRRDGSLWGWVRMLLVKSELTDCTFINRAKSRSAYPRLQRLTTAACL